MGRYLEKLTIISEYKINLSNYSTVMSIWLSIIIIMKIVLNKIIKDVENRYNVGN
jgi:hypothetical protein